MKIIIDNFMRTVFYTISSGTDPKFVRLRTYLTDYIKPYGISATMYATSICAKKAFVASWQY